MFAPRYLFKSTWEVEHPPGDIYDVLLAVLDYPRWWPAVHEVTRVNNSDAVSFPEFAADQFRMVVRAFLPYRITYIVTRDITDRATGRIEATVDGDIEGRIGWKIDYAPGGALVRFREEVETHIDALNALAPVARWAFELNHQLMMRDGLVGLRGYLAGRTPSPQVPEVRQPGEGYS